MNYRITYTVLAFDFYLELKFAKKKKSPCITSNNTSSLLIISGDKHIWILSNNNFLAEERWVLIIRNKVSSEGSNIFKSRKNSTDLMCNKLIGSNCNAC